MQAPTSATIDRQILVMDAQSLFHRMREWRVTDIVKQGCGAHRKSILCRDRITLAQAIENPRHQVQRAKAVGES